MAFKMKNPSVMKMAKMAGNNRTAMKMKAEEAAAMKMKKAAMKLKEEAAMKMKKSAMKAAKPDFPDIDGDGNTSESMKKAAADKKSGMKMKKESAMKLDKSDAEKVAKAMASGAKAGGAAAGKKSAMKLSEADKEKAMENAMPAAKVEGGLSKETMAASKKHFGGVNPSTEKVNSKIKEYESILNRTGLPESSVNKYKTLLAEARSTAKKLGR